MNLTKEQIIEEIKKGSEIGKEIFEVELEYYKSLVKTSNNAGGVKSDG